MILGYPYFRKPSYTQILIMYIYICADVYVHTYDNYTHVYEKNKEKIKQVHVAHQSRTPHVKTLVPTWHVQQEVVSPITYSTINPSCLSYICTNF
jgi:hypothetical protein